MVAKSGRGWKLAPCLVALVDEADRLAPGRNRRSDGSIGDPAHAARTSDHNPSNGWVCAVDITDDDAGGMNARALVDHLVAVRDHRVKYLIHEGRIWRSYDKPGLPAWQSEEYRGSNAHLQHAHVSTHNTPAARNDRSSWFDSVVRQEEADMDPTALVILTYASVLGRVPTNAETSHHVAQIAKVGQAGWVNTIARSDEAVARRQAS